MDYFSSVWIASTVSAGVRFRVRRLSLSGRMDLMREVRNAASCLEFLSAGGTGAERADGALVAAQLDEIYLRWGFEEIHGLRIDGEHPTADLLLARGPEYLAREIAQAVRDCIFLSEDDRKN